MAYDTDEREKTSTRNQINRDQPDLPENSGSGVPVYIWLPVLVLILVLSFNYFNKPASKPSTSREQTTDQKSARMAYEPNVVQSDIEIVEHLSENGWESIDFLEYSAVTRVASVDLSPASAKAREILKEMQDGKHKFMGRDGNTKLKNLLGGHYRTLITECERVGIFTLNHIYSLGKQDFILTIGGKGAMFIRISEVEQLLKDRGYNIDFWRVWKLKTDLNPEDFKSKGIHTGIFKIAPAGPKTLEWVLQQKWSELSKLPGVGKSTGDDLHRIIETRRGKEKADE